VQAFLIKSLQAFLLSVVLMFSLVFQPSVAIADTQALPACVDSDCNCSDFSTQEAAQTVLNAFPGDRFRLDGDKDGAVQSDVRTNLFDCS